MHNKINYNVLLNVGKLQVRNLMVETEELAHKWYKLGLALCIPFDELGKLYAKHNDNPKNALIRVYRYWLADKKGLQPTWDKLLTALQYIKEYTIATRIGDHMKV